MRVSTRIIQISQQCEFVSVAFLLVSGLIPLCLALINKDDLLRLRPGVFIALGWG